MRSAILFGAIIIADAISNGKEHSDEANSFLLSLFILFIVMDIVELFKKNNK